MTNTFSGSAKIYAFPPRGRFAISSQNPGGDSEASMPAAAMQLPREVKLVSGSAWYHDEAIQDAIKTAPRWNS
jgi:hypothetical protein